LVSNEKIVKSSYLVAPRVAQAKKAHAIAKNLILPAASDMREAVLEANMQRSLKKFLCQTTTYKRNRWDSNEIKAQLLERLRRIYFAIHLDDTTDNASQAQLLVYIFGLEK